MNFGDQVWLVVIAAALGLVGGVIGGAVSGDIVSKRAFKRSQDAQQQALSANWAFERIGSAASLLRNVGDESGLNIVLEWRPGGEGRLEAGPHSCIDPGDNRRLQIAPLTQERRVLITWDRPNGEHRSVEREVPHR